jgi:hypothetical protein
MSLRAPSGECEAKKPLSRYPITNSRFLVFKGIWLIKFSPQQV